MAQRILRRIGGRPRGQRTGVSAVDMTKANAVKRHLSVMNGLLELARGLIKAHRVLLVTATCGKQSPHVIGRIAPAVMH
jgi:hypothetical protein